MVALAVACALGSAAAQTPAVKHEPGAPQTIAAPHYGDTLFLFYQDKTFAAITGLMVSQHFERVSPHDEEAEVLRGGMLLSYGLHDEAAAVFASLIERNAAPAVRDRAWYFLAKARHQRGLNPLAEESLARIAGKLPGTLEEDRQLLQAQLMMEREDFAGAAAVLDTMQNSPTAGLYARFNLGVSLVRIGDAERGYALLDAVGQTPAPNEELRSLRDRANVALGFASLAGKKPREARVALQRVRLNSAMSNKALLGFGWAAAELNDPKLALVPWTELAGRGAIGQGDAAVLESRIAVPYALAELGAYSSALQGYNDAADGFEKEGIAIMESIAAIRAGKLVQGLIAQNPTGQGQGLGAASGIKDIPEMPHAAHLVPLLATDEFQEAFKNLRDLQFLDGNLLHWQDNLGAYVDMLDNRRKAFAARLEMVQASTDKARLEELQRQRNVLAYEMDKVQAERDVQAYATPRERDMLERVERGRATLAEVGSDPDLADAAERLRRTAGALTWKMAQDFSARDWEAKKALRSTTIALAQARDREGALTQAAQDEPLRHARFAERIAELAQRVAGLRPEVAVATAAVQQQLQDVAVAELERQQERLVVYAAQARLAIAQIHDRAQFARRGDAAETPR